MREDAKRERGGVQQSRGFLSFLFGAVVTQRNFIAVSSYMHFSPAAG